MRVTMSGFLLLTLIGCVRQQPLPPPATCPTVPENFLLLTQPPSLNPELYQDAKDYNFAALEALAQCNNDKRAIKDRLTK